MARTYRRGAPEKAGSTVAEKHAVLVHPEAPIRLAPVANWVPSPGYPEALLVAVENFFGRGEVSHARRAGFRVRAPLAVGETSGRTTGDAVGDAVEAR